MSGGEKRERLESPSGELKMLRKQLLVEKLMTKNCKIDKETKEDSCKEGEAAKKSLKLGASTVLSRVKDFLPQMKSANDQLSRLTDLSSVSVEAEVPEEQDEEGFIEMNLAFMPQADSEEESDFEESLSSEEEDDEDKNDVKISKDELHISTSKSKKLISELDD